LHEFQARESTALFNVAVPCRGAGKRGYGRGEGVSYELSEKELVITDAANHRAFVAAAKPRTTPDGVTYTIVPHVTGIAHYPDLKPGFKLESLTANW
jgi:hypothetical protein